MTLRWERQKDTSSLYGFSGDRIIAMVVTMSDGSGFSWQIDGVRVKWVAKTDGLESTEQAAVEAADQSWAAWLGRAKLVPVGDRQ